MDLFERGQFPNVYLLVSRACHRPQLNEREFSIRSNTIARSSSSYTAASEEKAVRREG